MLHDASVWVMCAYHHKCVDTVYQTEDGSRLYSNAEPLVESFQ